MNDNDILKTINKFYKEDVDSLYTFLLQQLQHESNNIEFWISLGLVTSKPPIVDEETSIIFLNKALDMDNNNPITLLILAYVYEHEIAGIDDMLLHQIRTLNTDSNEINSMLKYVASWSYRESKKYNPAEEEKLLKESIALYDKHVWNYEHLARLYIKQKRYLEVNCLIKKALSNIQKIYSSPNDYNYNATDIDEFINQRIKGIYVNHIGYEIVEEKLIPQYKIIFYTIMTPILNFYHFIKTAILRSMNFEE